LQLLIGEQNPHSIKGEKMIQQRTFFSIFLILLLFSTGCGTQSKAPMNIQSKGNNSTNQHSEVPPADPDSEGLPQTSDAVVDPSGWSEVIIDANSARTKLDFLGHFKTSRNACGKEAYGVMELEDWNALATQSNLAIQSGLSQSESCIDVQDYTSKFMDGLVTYKLTSGETKTLFTYRDSQICSNLQDKEISAKLLQLIEKLILLADKQECPNGWGSSVRSL
jgi:hypothetical protein